MENENPPILKTWNNLYALVIAVLFIVIMLLYFFTEYFK